MNVCLQLNHLHILVLPSPGITSISATNHRPQPYRPLWLPFVLFSPPNPIFYSLPSVFSVFRQRNLYCYVRRDVLLPTPDCTVHLRIYCFSFVFSAVEVSRFLVFRPLDYCRCSRSGHVTSCRSPAQGTLAMSYCHCTRPPGLGTPCSSGCVNSDFVLSAA